MDDGLDLFAPEEPGPGFPIHTITVTRIEYDEPNRFGIDLIDCEYEIDHGRCELRGEECIVEGIVSDIGLHQSFFGVWDKGEEDNRLEEGKAYRVRGWASMSPATPNGPAEYDAGIEPVDDDDET